jgi:hypothetical protein
MTLYRAVWQFGYGRLESHQPSLISGSKENAVKPAEETFPPLNPLSGSVEADIWLEELTTVRECDHARIMNHERHRKTGSRPHAITVSLKPFRMTQRVHTLFTAQGVCSGNHVFQIKP